MKKVVKTCLALMLGILMTVNVYADSGMAQYPDYVTDYYMVVESPNGGIDFYVEASFNSSKLNEELIPNGTAFHIEGEVTDANKRVWGYSKYHGMTGYICEDDCRMVTRSEAIKSELSIAQTAEADYDYVTAGEKILYNGPGEKFGKVSGSIVIPEGTTVHIEKEAKLADGSDWGYTSYHYEGWIELESLVNIEEETITEETPAQESTGDVVNLENTNQGTAEADQESVEVENEAVEALNEENGASKEEKKAEVTSTPTPEPTATSTPTPEPTATNTPTPEPTATNTPTPEPTATSTPTPEPTFTNTPTPEATATSTPTAEPTVEAEPTEDAEKTTAEPTVTQAVQQEEASSSNVESAAEWYQNPMIWIGGICILLIIILLIYHFIKKNK